MIFAYLNLPPFPDDLIPACLKNIDLIDKDPILYEKINKTRGASNYGTWLPKEANEWLITNIVQPYFSPVRPEMQESLLGVTYYARHPSDPELNGQQGQHIDIGRNWAINYVFDTGGTNVVTRWFDEDKNFIASRIIKPKQWCLLKVDMLHSVRKIDLGRLRTFISMSVSVKDNEEFDALKFFDKVLDKSTII